jgi:hypothetical protein
LSATAAWLLSGGVDVRTVAGRLGHKNPNVTLSVYAHFLPEADRDPLNERQPVASSLREGLARSGGLQPGGGVTIAKLAHAEDLLRQVALGVDDHHPGAGEHRAPLPPVVRLADRPGAYILCGALCLAAFSGL